MTSKRLYCAHCDYPSSTCVCSAIGSIQLPISVIILQHKKEVFHAKNTIRLACLVSPSIRVISTALCEQVNNTLTSLDANNTAVIYPSNESKAIENNQHLYKNIKTLIFLDGSWKQAYSIWREFPLLQRFMQMHFKSAPPKQYSIRKSKKEHQLSSIEALSYSISIVTKIDTSEYLSALAKMQKYWPNIDSKP